MFRTVDEHWKSQQRAGGFTLVELLIVISIAGFLLATLGVTIANYLENAREQQTVATLRKIEGLIAERLKGLERAYKKPDFETFVTRFQKQLQAGDANQGIPLMPGFSREATEMLARKLFARMLFPQTLSEGIPLSSEDLNGNGVLDAGEDKNGNGTLDYYRTVLDRIRGDQGVQFNYANHVATAESRKTESSELLYYALTSMELFGIAPVPTEFRDTEVRDTDGDGMLEFIDGWGRPLRFYRSPTRLIKPYGMLGPDGYPGSQGDDDPPPSGMGGVAEDFAEIGFIGPPPGSPPGTPPRPTDDHYIASEWRQFAGLFIGGLPRAPYQGASGGGVLVNYDQLNQDPDDPYGLLISEFRRLSITNPNITPTALVNTERAASPLWSFPTFDVFHKPLVVSAGPDGELGILEPFPTVDFDNDGTVASNEDVNGDQQLVIFGHLAIPRLVAPLTTTNVASLHLPDPTVTTPGPYIQSTAFDQASDNITNRNRAAGGRR